MDLSTSYRVYSRYYKKIGPFFKKPRVQAYTMLILSFFTMSFFGIFAIKPTLKTIAHLRKEIADSRLVNKSLEEKIRHLAQVREEYKKIENDLPLVFKALPQEPEVSFFLQDLEQLTNKVGATISAIRVGDVSITAEAQSAKAISSSLIIEADFSSCQDFLTWLLNAKRLYTIQSLKILSNLEEGKNLIKLDLMVNAYHLKPKFYVQ